MNDKESVIKNLEALYSMVSILAAVISATGVMSEQDTSSFMCAANKYDTAHLKLVRRTRTK